MILRRLAILTDPMIATLLVAIALAAVLPGRGHCRHMGARCRECRHLRAVPA
ncbi:MAG: hypothetical protein ACJLS3_03945 [Erythrobacter sp.]